LVKNGTEVNLDGLLTPAVPTDSVD